MTFYDILFSALNGWSSKLTHYGNLFADFMGGIAKLLAKFLKIKGNTIVWNQLVHLFVQHNGVKATQNSNGLITLSGTSTGGYANVFSTNPIIINHIYLLLASVVSNPNNVSFRFNINNAVGQQLVSGYNMFCKGTSTGNSAFGISSFSSGTVFDGITGYCNVFDLTAMFGSTKADEIYAMEQSESGSGVAYFRSLFPLPYYQYDAGSLLSFNGSGIKTVGKNLYQDGDVDVNNILFKSVTLTEPIEAGTYIISAIISHPEGTTGNRVSFRNRNGSGIGAAELRGDSGARTPIKSSRAGRIKRGTS